ncbi:MAG: 2Fe-2S iron-sulfur cluster-binding protein, partial [Victivallaceae bacterium]
MIKMTINNIPVTVKKNTTILDAANKIGIKIPTLCHMELKCFDIDHTTGFCRICVVVVDG